MKRLDQLFSYLHKKALNLQYTIKEKSENKILNISIKLKNKRKPMQSFIYYLNLPYLKSYRLILFLIGVFKDVYIVYLKYQVKKIDKEYKLKRRSKP